AALARPGLRRHYSPKCVATMPPPNRTARVVLRIVIYFAAAWGIVATLASGLFPGAPFVALAIAAYTTIPVLVFARWSGWPFYPGAAFRLFVVRPFWYT